MPGIFIPDFALTRDSRRIYMEILGFWTPAYRERKIQKLQQLQERNDILLAIPAEARDAFATIANSFPIAWYEGQLSATELLNVLRSAYDDFAERLAQLDPGVVQEHVRRTGLVPERACYDLLHCYRRSEVQRGSERVVGGDIAFVSGIGLFSHHWMEHLRGSFVEWIGEAGRLSLADVLRESRERWPQLTSCEDATIEAILGLWPEAVCVNRTSIFAATVEAVTAANDVGAQFIAPAPEPVSAPPKRQVRERKPAYKKRLPDETIQGDLWG